MKDEETWRHVISHGSLIIGHWSFPMRGSGESAAEHPGRLLVGRKPLGQKVRRCLIAAPLGRRENRTNRTDGGLVPLGQKPDHLLRGRYFVFLRDGGQARELPQGCRHGKSEGANPLGELIR